MFHDCFFGVVNRGHFQWSVKNILATFDNLKKFGSVATVLLLGKGSELIMKLALVSYFDLFDLKKECSTVASLVMLIEDIVNGLEGISWLLDYYSLRDGVLGLFCIICQIVGSTYPLTN